ncbi:hypothetical protein [Parasphingorhabdus halotolerans]|uniref:Cytochrome c domain-containing protein n=1 Tax=Parasphingorhabdus halotolerans TaxID=2725558 RepID=A0A6H2DM85_9SPHN|nr:hypothetical protein [Parasphingorhabdus halotolerans]QJB69464.1 hypothetical protein HF685_09370 [Parasphingorhabdus halotolerans]
MDYRGKALLSFCTIAVSLASAVAFAADAPLLRAVTWLENEPSAQLEALGKKVVVAPRTAAETDTRWAVGRAIFQTPILLGGQAAKAGISCESCHSGGTANPHFRFPGMSSAPGTADVTHSFFSKLRGNSTFDPVPIPDLTKTGKVSHEGQALEEFIRGLIVEEFGGLEPDGATLDALAFYVRGLRDAEKRPSKMLTVDEPLSNINSAVSLGKSAARAGQFGAAKLLLASARHQLGLIHERYAGSRLARHRKALSDAAQSLGQIQNQLDEQPERVSSALLRWDKLFYTKQKALRRDEGKSLYNPDLLKNLLDKQEL